MEINFHRALSGLRDAALAAIFPQQCRVCGSQVDSWSDGVACRSCWLQIELKQDNDYCFKCGSILNKLPSQTEITQRRCGKCDDLFFVYSRSCGPYTGAIRESVIWLKSNPQICPHLRKMLSARLFEIENLQKCDSIIPAPLHPARLADRGFNQAEVIAQTLAAMTDARLDAASLVRVKETSRHRAGLGVQERTHSLQNAFEVRAPRLINNRVILLVDDVMTTGATVNEAARNLLQAGARAVNVLTIARARIVGGRRAAGDWK